MGVRATFVAACIAGALELMPQGAATAADLIIMIGITFRPAIRYSTVVQGPR